MQAAISTLTICHSAMTYYEFCHATEKMKHDMDDAHLYIIAKRELPIMHFKSMGRDEICLVVNMESHKAPIEIVIRAHDNSKVFPDGFWGIKTGSNLIGSDPGEKFHYLSIASGINTNTDELIFDFHTNFDRLIHLYHHNLLKLEIHGDVTPFITYEVLYVGQCAKQHITKRFDGHHAISEIMGSEIIVPKDHDKNEEIIIIPFKLNSIEITSLTADTMTTELDKVVATAEGNGVASDNEYIYDGEKALIRALDPKYNKDKFLNYPQSENGLYQHEFDSIGYAIDEDIILYYGESNMIFGGSMGESLILVKENKDFSIIHMI